MGIWHAQTTKGRKTVAAETAQAAREKTQRFGFVVELVAVKWRD